MNTETRLLTDYILIELFLIDLMILDFMCGGTLYREADYTRSSSSRSQLGRPEVELHIPASRATPDHSRAPSTGVGVEGREG